MSERQYSFELSDYTLPTLEAEIRRVLDLLDAEIKQAEDEDASAFEQIRIRWVGKNNKNNFLAQIAEIWLKKAPREAKPLFGQNFNSVLKPKIEEAVERALVWSVAHEETLGLITNQATKILSASSTIDITLPGAIQTPGIAHPLIETMNAVVQVFHQLGYSTSLGPQVESDFYNFEALNFPQNHPARDTQDTLQIAGQSGRPGRDRLLMRTHTSPVQIRSMIASPPPLRIVIPGKVHRNDAADATHSPIFHQVEGLCVGPDVTFSDLKGTLDHAMRALFGSGVKTRFFPSFFPFTEPSADVQISCIFCHGKGCRKCKHSGWIELLGCGMVDPAVFASVTEERRKLGLDTDAYDPARISGFAFGMGVERIAMILHGVSDIGHFYSGDMRFLEQFA